MYICSKDWIYTKEKQSVNMGKVGVNEISEIKRENKTENLAPTQKNNIFSKKYIR